jgi:hypothetical protein
MRDFCAGYAFHMIERNETWREYMEVEEEGVGAHMQV